MALRACPVCGIEQDADDLAFEHHVNSHFAEDDAMSEGRVGSSSPRKRRLSTYKDREELEAGYSDVWGSEDNNIDEDAVCPLCAFPFRGTKTTEREQHVNACMDSQPEREATPPPPTISHRPSRSFDRPRPPDIAISIDTGQRQHRPESTTFHMSDQLIQQSRNLAGGQGEYPTGAESWDGPAKPGGLSGWTSKADKRDAWWNPSGGKMNEIPSNFSPGLVPALQHLLEGPAHKAHIKSAVLGRDTIAISGVFRFDLSWGCGYRNALMAISSLIMHSDEFAELFSRENNGAEPGVRRLQGWLDEAWSNGFDPEGRAHFGGKVSGGSRWIGTGDLYALFSYKGVPCDLYDFPKPKKNGDRPAHRALTEWIKQYFDEGLPRNLPLQDQAVLVRPNAFDLMMHGSPEGTVRRADRFPVILQHNGHSRTVIGYEEASGGTISLLMIDPGKRVPVALREAGLKHTSSLRRTLTSTPADTSLVKKSSHDAMPFSRPYTDGNSALTQWRDDPISASTPPLLTHASPGAQRLAGGTAVDLAEDEVMDDRGWVRRRVDKLSHRSLRQSAQGMSAMGDPKGSMGSGKRAKVGAVDADSESKGLGYFRVNISALGHHAEYQVLAFTGDHPLSPSARNNRKLLTSVVIR